MRARLFQALYWITSIMTVIIALPLLVIPGRKWLMIWLQRYSRLMKYWMRVVVGIDVEYRGRPHLPDGPCIIAPKHQSWGDGYAMFAKVNDLAIVTGDHLEKIPLVGLVLKKMQAVVVDSCGGAEARNKLVTEDLANARAKNRKILIYPEGRLGEPGYHFEYKKGIYHMYEAYGAPVVPVATNLGLYWPHMTFDSFAPGTAVVEFLEPIQPGMEKDAFMALLEERIETASLALLPDDFEIPEHRLLVFDKEKDRGVPAPHTDDTTESQAAE
ncbi:MAG: 1-acyl-sn-glycerol-3-phosphate acyltransferase [Pseudomonadota bacterium]